MSYWEVKPVTLKFQLSDKTLFSAELPLSTRSEDPLVTVPCSNLIPPEEDPLPGSHGFLIRNLPIESTHAVLTSVGTYLRYIPLQYQHCFIDLSTSFEQYERKFSSKTKSTLRRKVRKFAENSGGRIVWKTYRSPDQLEEFFHHARSVSRLTYQERLLNVGLPDSDGFRENARRLALKDQLRAYLLFDREKPVSYLYCPEKDGVLKYAYLGYDPEYQYLSVGTVLQWLAVEQMFDEKRFRFFDFTEGNSNHKILFSSEQRLCANVYFIGRNWRDRALVYSQYGTNMLSAWLGKALDRYGMKARVKRLLRRP